MCTPSLVEVYNGTLSGVRAPRMVWDVYDMVTSKKTKKINTYHNMWMTLI
jgi:hypothetical protein